MRKLKGGGEYVKKHHTISYYYAFDCSSCIRRREGRREPSAKGNAYDARLES
jgi:hypothetical protein